MTGWCKQWHHFIADILIEHMLCSSSLSATFKLAAKIHNITLFFGVSRFYWISRVFKMNRDDVIQSLMNKQYPQVSLLFSSFQNLQFFQRPRSLGLSRLVAQQKIYQSVWFRFLYIIQWYIIARGLIQHYFYSYPNKCVYWAEKRVYYFRDIYEKTDC